MSNTTNAGEPVSTEIKEVKQVTGVTLYRETETESRIPFYYLQLPTGALIILANGFLLFCFIHRAFLKRKQNIYIFFLCISDLLAGIDSLFISAVMLNASGESDAAKYACVTAGACHYFAHGVSLLSMALATVERYVHIVHPFAHARFSESWVHLLIVVTGWSLLFIVSILLLYFNNWRPNTPCYMTSLSPPFMYLILTSLITWVLLIIMCVLMVKIILLTRKHEREIAALQLTIRRQVIANPAENYTTSGKGEVISGMDGITSGKCDITSGKRDITSGKRDITSGKRDINSGKCDITSGKRDITSATVPPAFEKVNKRRTSLVVALIFVTLICWTPIILVTVLNAALPVETFKMKAWSIFAESSIFLMLISSLLNPFLYQRFSPDIKKAYMLIFRKRNFVHNTAIYPSQ